MSRRRSHHEELFRAAVEARDFARAELALRQHVAWFKSASRDCQEVESARELVKWGISVTSAHRIEIAEELMRLKTVVDAYLPRKPGETWRMVG